MAIRTIYRGSHKGHRLNDTWKVEIIDTDHPNTNPPDELPPLAEGVQITWGSDRDIHEPLIASEAEINVYSDSGFFVWAVNTLSISDEGRFYLKVYKNDAIFWRGIILSDRFEWQDTGDPVKIKIRAICGIGRLKSIKINPNDVLDAFVNILRYYNRLLSIASGNMSLYADGERFISTSMFWFETEMPITLGTGDPLRYISFNGRGISSKVNTQNGETAYTNYYDLLKVLLLNFGCNVAMSDGCWRIWQYPALNGTGTSIRQYSYDKTFSQADNPNSGTVNVIDNYVNTNVKRNILKTIGASNLVPLASVNNSYEPSVWRVITRNILDPSLLIYKRFAVDLTTPDNIPYTFATDFGFVIQGVTRIRIVNNTANPLIIRANAQITVRITDGINNRYLNAANQWQSSLTALPILFDVDQVPNGTERWFDLPFIYQTQELPFAGTIILTITCTAQGLPALTNQNALIQAKQTDIEIRYYSISGTAATQQQITLQNNSSGQNSTIELNIGDTVLTDRAAPYFTNAARIYDGSIVKNSVFWRVNDTGTSRGLVSTLLHHILTARQRPIRRLEGAYIGYMAPHYKAVLNDEQVFVFVSGVFSTMYDTMTRVQMQRLQDTVLEAPGTLGLEVFGLASGGATGSTTTAGELGGLIGVTGGGILTDPIEVGTGITEINLVDPAGIDIPLGTEIIVFDAATGLYFTVTTSTNTLAADTVIDVDAFDLTTAVTDGQLFFSQTTLLGLSGGGDNWTWGATSTAPSNTIGNDGDEFVTSAGRIYEKVAGAWVLKLPRLVTGASFSAPLDTPNMEVVMRVSTGNGSASGVNINDLNTYTNTYIEHSGTTGTIALSSGNSFKPIVYMNYTGASTLRLPAGSAANSSLVVVIKNINTGTVTVERATTDTTSTINGATDYDVLPDKYCVFQYRHAATDWTLLFEV